jgi:uncharacterized protein (TIGR01777 family)
MKILISGSHGLIGSALVPFLKTGGHAPVRLQRGHSVDLERAAAVVHLAGESIAEGRWTLEKKARIYESRVQGTRDLCEALAKLEHPPRVLVCASAIGLYGNRGDEVLTEDSSSGKGFLTDVCRDWEAATKPAADKGIRVVNLRFGMVLSSKGGALAKMLFPFRLGAGGIIGNGRQWWSWIALDDAVRAIHHAIVSDNVKDGVNAVSPQPVTNQEFTQTLGRILGRPTLLPMPGFAARLALGEMADALLLCSARVQPRKLLETRFEFRLSPLEVALRHLLGKTLEEGIAQ